MPFHHTLANCFGSHLRALDGCCRYTECIFHPTKHWHLNVSASHIMFIKTGSVKRSKAQNSGITRFSCTDNLDLLQQYPCAS